MLELLCTHINDSTNDVFSMSNENETDESYLNRLNDSFCLQPLTKEEHETCKSLLEQDKGSDMIVMPTHGINEHGSFQGFTFSAPKGVSSAMVPLTHRTFHGHTATECSHNSGPVNQDVIRLLSNIDKCKSKMLKLIQSIDQFPASERCSLDCMPENIDAVIANESGKTSMGAVCRARAVDSKRWLPEVPVCMGLYHAYTRGFNRDNREHKLFIVVSGGCTKASDEFYNLMLDVGGKTSVDEMHDSQEAWWLRKACYRSRCHLIRMLAETFDLRINQVADIHAYDDTSMAVSTIDTLTNDIQRLRNGNITVFNECCNTTSSRNGILCSMNPAEGYWLFKGPTNYSQGCYSYGGVFGSQEICGAMPSTTFHVPYTQGKVPVMHTSTVRKHPDNVIQLSSERSNRRRYMVFDEKYMKNLEAMEWNRDNGVVELMPIVVGMC